jgi:hypothetical protein
MRNVLLVFVVLALICGTGFKSGAWAQQSAPPVSDQKPETLTTSQPSRTAQCSVLPALDQKSVAVFEQQAANGDAAAQCGLGGMYEVGTGVPQDYVQAAFWYRKAAEQGDAVAQVSLGYLYHEGHGVPQDYTQALAWCRKAAEQGNADAQKSLGRLYHEGQGVPRDYTLAAAWWRKAAEQGDAEAQYLLGLTYLVGKGVPQDWAEAYFWIDVAVAGKLDASEAEQAAKSRDEILSYLTPADLSREQERARKWFEAHQAKPQ